jgi:ABC-type dipeptide/oligopeptide/nickel transport system permease component
VKGVENHDYTMVQALVMLTAFTFVLTNFAVDLICAWLDPRIRYS